MSGAIRQRAHEHGETQRTVGELVSRLGDLMEALPSPHVRTLATDLARASTPISAAIRERASTPDRLFPGRPDTAVSMDASSAGEESRPVSAGVPGPGWEERQLQKYAAGRQVTALITGEDEVASFLVEKIANQKWPYKPGSIADTRGRDTLHLASAQLVKESQKLLENLSDADAAKVLMLMLESNSHLAAAMRARMPAADHSRLFLPSDRPSTALDELAHEGEQLLNMVSEDMAEDILKTIARGNSQLAEQLLAKMRDSKAPPALALRDLAAESK